MKTLGLLTMLLIATIAQVQGQGLVSQSKQLQDATRDYTLGCGSADFMEHLDRKRAGYYDIANKSMTEMVKNISIDTENNSRSEDNIFVIPVVFHVVYHDSFENISNTVIQNQLDVLNNSFRRMNADTSSLRPIFQGIVGDSKIEFVLAQTDPDGNPTSGITRTYSDVTYFGGILPYGPGQNQEIIDWVNDSLFYNLFRITNDTLGGINAWDTDKYLNVWIGDLRIFEPKFNNFEEIVFFGLATPPIDHHNWPDSMLNNVNIYDQGVIMHYVNIGANNPNNFSPPYSNFNVLVKSGKMLVHEVGHFLGLRHIWGDGDCSVDDFIYDTPNSSAASQWNCNKTLNSCVDNINEIDLPDMIENYMDYSRGSCQNSFTIGQIEVMHYVLNNYRPDIADIKVVSGNTDNNQFYNNIQVYPNPTTGEVTILSEIAMEDLQVNLRNIEGKLMETQFSINDNKINFKIEGSNGIYFLEILSRGSSATFKVIKL